MKKIMNNVATAPSAECDRHPMNITTRIAPP